MIVRNEAHVVHEVLDCVAPYISTWAIVDTGSSDGTQDVIRTHMAGLGIPGELIDRPWKNFGHNRSEALDFAAGRADYIWVIDADDLVVGTPDLSGLTESVYDLHYGPPGGFTYWRPQLFRDGMPWRYEGVVHEFMACDAPHQRIRLRGDYYIDSRRIGGRNLDPQKYARDRDLLLAEMERKPDDSRSAFYLAQSYFDLGDFDNARKWYQRRSEMGGWAEEVYYSMYRVGESMLKLDAPWPQTQDALLRAWEFRPTRAEALNTIARHYRMTGRYHLGHLFATRAAAIPIPEDGLFVFSGVYTWGAIDEQAVCASQLGLHHEAFALCRHLLTRSELPEPDRQRIAANRDYSVPAMLRDAVSYPEQSVRSMPQPTTTAEVTVSLVTGSNLEAAEHSLNSLLNSCTDRLRIGRVIVDDIDLPPTDRATFAERYPFTESLGASFTEPPPHRLRRISDMIGGRYWFYIGPGWRFFAPDNLISRLIAVLETEPDVLLVAGNYADAATLTGHNAPEDAVRRAPVAGRYVLTDSIAWGPAIMDVERLARIGGIEPDNPDVRGDLAARAQANGMRTATLDEVLCSGF